MAKENNNKKSLKSKIIKIITAPARLAKKGITKSVEFGKEKKEVYKQKRIEKKQKNEEMLANGLTTKKEVAVATTLAVVQSAITLGGIIVGATTTLPLIGFLVGATTAVSMAAAIVNIKDAKNIFKKYREENPKVKKEKKKKEKTKKEKKTKQNKLKKLISKFRNKSKEKDETVAEENIIDTPVSTEEKRKEKKVKSNKFKNFFKKFRRNSKENEEMVAEETQLGMPLPVEETELEMPLPVEETTTTNTDNFKLDKNNQEIISVDLSNIEIKPGLNIAAHNFIVRKDDEIMNEIISQYIERTTGATAEYTDNEEKRVYTLTR